MPHPLIEAVLEHFAAAYCAGLTRNPFEPKEDRAGWFGCSDLSDASWKPYSPRDVLLKFLGLHSFTCDNAGAWNMANGQLWDAMIGAALDRVPWCQGSQLHLEDPTLNLRGTPDFMVDWAGETIIGDVKSTGPKQFSEWTAPNWDPSTFHAARQLQAYLMLNETDRGFIFFVNQDGLRVEWDERALVRTKGGKIVESPWWQVIRHGGYADLANAFAVVPFYRNDIMIAALQHDLADLNRWLPAVLRAVAPDNEPEVTIRALRADPLIFKRRWPDELPEALKAALPTSRMNGTAARAARR